MPFVANTPESLLGRADSLNPNSTCRGITANGRPCRRGIVASQQPNSNRNGFLPSSLRPSTPDPRDERLYCWQHRDQASRSAQSSPGPRGTATPILEGRSSLDTLADRLGLVDLQEKPMKKHSGGRKSSSGSHRPARTSRPKPAKQLQFCFCFSIPIEEAEPPRPARPQPRPVQRTSAPVPPPRPPPSSYQGSKYKQQGLGAASAASSPGKSSYRSRKSSGSHTAQIKDFIPDSLDAATASALMAELARPHVDSEEPGFIYMFWLTPTSSSTATSSAQPPVDAARSLLAPPPSSSGPRSRRPSDVVSRFAAGSGSNTTGGGAAPGKMMLKIGRAANVQRRMNQWQRQCGYGVEVLRYYPYLPGASSSELSSSSPSSSGSVPRMTPHCHRVERLVHIELAGMGLRAQRDACAACGKNHREWFEVEATREGIRRVDEVVRRWVEWDERSV